VTFANWQKSKTSRLLLRVVSNMNFQIMKKLMLLFSTAIAAVILNSCASNQPASSTTTTTHQQGTGLPSQTMERHGM
jgi:hypothetical protein